jgi:hypothetical protein
MQKASEEYEERWQTYYDKLRKTLNRQYEDNAYRRCNWRRGSPECKYEQGWEWNEWHADDPANRDHYWWLFKIQHDLRLCDREFKWSQDEKLSQWFSDFDYLTQRCLSSIKSSEDELKWIDERNYTSAKKAWQEEDVEWIEYQKVIKEHRSHHPKQWYLDLFAKDKDAEEWYAKRGGIPNDDETCELCIQERKHIEEVEERQRIERELIQQEEEKQKQIILAQQAQKIKYHCELCDYHTTSKSNYDKHLESKQHLQVMHHKIWYCEKCQIQCRSESEYQTHIETKKHKKAMGEVEAKIWKCDVCDYTATLKHHYDNHCKSKKHIDKISK